MQSVWGRVLTSKRETYSINKRNQDPQTHTIHGLPVARGVAPGPGRPGVAAPVRCEGAAPARGVAAVERAGVPDGVAGARAVRLLVVLRADTS